MSKPLRFRGKTLGDWRRQLKQIEITVKNSNMLVFGIVLAVFAVAIGLWNSQTTSYAYAYTGDVNGGHKPASILFENKNKLFDGKVAVTSQDSEVSENKKKVSAVQVAGSAKSARPVQFLPLGQNKPVGGVIRTDSKQVVTFLNLEAQDNESNRLAEKLYEIVGETPIKEMVPFISQRDDKVAAFLVGIAKKESSFGLASPSKDGQTCYNYWGYKGAGGRGTGMGYACFASAEEAIKVVGDRIEVLVSKNRNTPARMVDTWKCGTSCAGDPGAPSWVSTVAMYFNKIVG